MDCAKVVLKQIFKLLLVENGEDAIGLALDHGGPWLVVDESQLTETVSIFERAHIIVPAHFV